MSGVSPKLPLQGNDVDGHYALNKTFKEATKQNLKNLILTVPGEKIMNPNFGAGIYELLFEQSSPFLVAELSSKIREQVDIYMPHVEIQNVESKSSEGFETSGISDPHILGIRIKYRIPLINDSDQLDITLE